VSNFSQLWRSEDDSGWNWSNESYPMNSFGKGWGSYAHLFWRLGRSMQEPKQIGAHPKEVSNRLAARAISFEMSGRLGMAIEKAGAIANCQQLELQEEITIF
jgi:hypothetical protein